jgi:hypothetical protein
VVSGDGRDPRLVLQRDKQAVLTSVELALEAGAPTKTNILNFLHRPIDGKPINRDVEAFASRSDLMADQVVFTIFSFTPSDCARLIAMSTSMPSTFPEASANENENGR